MRTRSAVATFLLALTSVGYAEEVEPPKFSSAPIEYASRYGGRLLIGDKTAQELKFWFNVPGANNHQCNMAGTAKAEDPETYVLIERNCRLEMKVLGQAVVLIDVNHECRNDGRCGSRAYINGATFLRKRGN